jgi:hypothetical protein
MKSVNSRITSDEWEVLCRLLPRGWRAAAKSRGALRRVRGVANASILLRVLMVHLADGCSLIETAVRAMESGWCRISAVALFKRLQAAEDWLRWMAEQLWRRRESMGIPEGRCFRAVDATVVCEGGRTGSRWRVHFSLRLADLQCDFFELTDTKGGETFRRLPVHSRDVIMGDRAYATPPGIAHVVGKGGELLVRMTTRTLPLFTESGRKFSLLRHFRPLRAGEVGDWRVWVHHAENQIEGRVIAIRRSDQATKHVRRRMEIYGRHKQRRFSAHAMELAGFVFVWTNLPKSDFPARKVLALYRLRWQIELAFKRMKTIMGLGQLPKQADASSRAWLHGKLLVALLLERLIEEANALSPWGYPLEEPAEPVEGDAVHVS